MPFLTLLVLAHNTYPLAYQIHETPGQPRQLNVGTSFGLLVSDDDGASWRWICEEAIGIGQNQFPVWWVGPQGRLLAGGFRGLFSSTDRGCTWSTHPEFDEQPDGGQGTGVSDLHQGAGASLFATSSKYGVFNGVWRSRNDGVDWQRLAVMSDEEFYTTVRTAPSRPQRVYVAGWWYRPDYTEVLYVSDDDGDTFTRVDVTDKMPIVPVGRDGGMGRARGPLYVYAVHPTDPNTLYAVLNQEDDPRRSFLVESSDQGQSWVLSFESVEQLTGVVVPADLGRVWVASTGRLYSNAGGAFGPLERPTRFACAAQFDDRFYTCGWPEIDGFAVGRLGDGGFEPVLTWPRVESIAQCPASSPVRVQCEGFFPALLASFPKPVGDGGTGGGAGGGGAGGGGGGGDMNPRGCGCGAIGAEVSLTLLLLVGRFASAHALRRRRVHR